MSFPFRRPLSRLGTSSFLRSVAVLVSAGVVGQLIQLVAIPLVARLYTPSDFGVFAVFTAIFAISLVISGLRYELAIPLVGGENNALALLLLVLALNGFSAFVVVTVIFFWGSWIADALNVPDLWAILWLLPVVLIGAGGYKSFQFWAIRNRAFSIVARTRVFQSASNAALQLGCGFISLGPTGLAAGQLAGSSMGVMSLARLVPFSRLAWIKRTLLRRMRILAVRYKRFPKYDIAASLTDEVSVQLPNILLASLFSPTVAGFYILVDRIVMRPLGLISQSIGQVMYSRSREHISKGNIATYSTYIVLTLLIFISIPTIIMFVYSEDIFVILFGEKWGEAGIYAGWLTVGMAAHFIYSSVSLTLMATNAQNINLCIHVSMLALKVSALLYGYFVGSAFAAIVAVALANGLGYLGAIVLVIFHTSRYTRHGARRLVRLTD